MARGVSIELQDGNGSLVTNVTGITALFWSTHHHTGCIRGQESYTTEAFTDGNGKLELNIEPCSALRPTEYGYLMLRKSYTPHTSSLIFYGKVLVTTVPSSATPVNRTSTNVFPSYWPSIPANDNSTQRFAGVYELSSGGANKIAFQLTVTGGYTVDWGDGSSAENVASGVVARHTYDYWGLTSVWDSGKDSEISCTFQDTGDTVTITGHTFSNGEMVAFSEINTTTGISVDTPYYIVSTATNTFKVATIYGGTALALTTDGTGKLYIPRVKYVLVQATRQVITNDITALRIPAMPLSGTMNSYPVDLLRDVAIYAPNCTDFVNTVTYKPSLQQLVRLNYVILGTWTVGGTDYKSGWLSASTAIKCLKETGPYEFNINASGALKSSVLPANGIQIFGNVAKSYVESLSIGGSTNFSASHACVRYPWLDFGEYPLYLIPTDMAPLMEFNTHQKLFTRNITVTITYQYSYSDSSHSASLALSSPRTRINYGSNAYQINYFCGDYGSTSIYCAGIAGPLDQNIGNHCQITFSSQPWLEVVLINEPNTLGGSLDQMGVSGAMLNAIYTSLPSATATLSVTGCWGAAYDNPSIATAKGWTVSVS
jgi:hypothetical protein